MYRSDITRYNVECPLPIIVRVSLAKARCMKWPLWITGYYLVESEGLPDLVA